MSVLNIIKTIARSLLEKVDLFSLYSLKHSGPLFEDGWFRSYREKSAVNANGDPIPWITYPALDFIRKRVTCDLTVFEFGSGGSTTWWANHVKNVVSVEHDRDWYERIKSLQRSNVKIFHVELIYGGKYSCSTKEQFDKFDIIVIDGRDRVNCIKNSIDSLKPTGIIILDNSDRLDYVKGIDLLHDKGFRRIEFIGFCPIVNLKSETSIFYRPNNIFGI
jgi:hypothetical protein